MTHLAHLSFTLFLTVVGAAAAQPLPQAHAHNDYEHEPPLLDALDHGFASVEADVWLVFGDLFVAHDAHELTMGRTLESLYLDPLADAGLEAAERRRLFLPFGTPVATGAALRGEGWVTVAALDADDTAAAQLCTHVLVGGEATAI